MTDRVKQMLTFYRKREYRQRRIHDTWDLETDISGMDQYQISTVYMAECLRKEKPVIFENDMFGFNRHIATRPGKENGPLVTVRGIVFHERISNIVAEYDRLIRRGFDAVIADIDRNISKVEDKRFYTNARSQLLEIIDLCDRYRDAANEKGCKKLYNALCRIPRQGAESLYEACLFQKILIFALRCGQYKHLAMGRFDQYMYPYYQADRKRGMSDQQLLEILELYFISLNFDTDLYDGIQQGDNGQSIVLGGFDLDGTDCYNELSGLCLDASAELRLIDPKINIRVGKKTPNSVYAHGTKLTKHGLGFPQYCNDDVIVPGLINLGYAPKDAANYAVAACWEPIIPGRGADVPNRSFMVFPTQLMVAMERAFLQCEDFNALMQAVAESIQERAKIMQQLCWGKEKYYWDAGFNPSPLISLMMDGCLESGKDISTFCLPYHNHGTFGVGISTAADSLAAVKKLVYDEKVITREKLMQALHDNFEGHEQLRSQLLHCPKMGDDNDEVDAIAAQLLDIFVDALQGKSNGSGGIWRVGTGSAQMYILKSADCPATPDGRKYGEPFSCSFSPSPYARVSGPLSVLRSFTKRDLTDLINGGPITMELHDTVFRNAMGEEKVAQLVKLFVLSGGHQLQLNAINRELLLDAQKNPQNHPNLIVRVWGWSGYFCELDPEFQNHILKRTEYTL